MIAGFALVLACAISARAGLPTAACGLQKLTAPDAAEQDRFGIDVSLSGDRAIVGAADDDCPGVPDTYCGSAHVYRYDGTTWVHEQKLTANDTLPGDGFGYAVFLSGDRAIVGAVADDCPAGNYCGSAYVFRFDGMTWVQEHKLTASDAADGDRFGSSVSLSGDRAIVGAPYGHSAYVYRRDGTAWTQEQKLTAFDAHGGYFGNSVSLSGDKAIVGAYFDECPGAPHTICGSVYVYRYDGTVWVPEQKFTASDVAHHDTFGGSVSLSGDRAIVGAFGDECAGRYGCGSAYVYRYDGTTWVQEVKLTASDPADPELFGYSVSLSGDRAIVGAFRDDCPAGVNCGTTYVYRYDGTSWVQQQKLNASDAAQGDHFGASVSLSGDRAIMGANRNDCAAGTDCGSAYIFDLGRPDCQPNGVPDTCDIRDGFSPDKDGNGIPDECETGACCDGETGLCANNVPMTACTGGQRSWSVNTLCAALNPPCSQHTGACCNLLNGACLDDVLPGGCAGEQQRWTKDTSCIQTGCEAVTGACCDRGPFGGCTDGSTRADCDCQGCQWSKLASCDDVTCTPREPIPTVNSWGLLILGLSIAVSARAKFHRMKSSARWRT